MGLWKIQPKKGCNAKKTNKQTNGTLIMSNELRRIWRWSWRILSYYLIVCIDGTSKRTKT